MPILVVNPSASFEDGYAEQFTTNQTFSTLRNGAGNFSDYNQTFTLTYLLGGTTSNRFSGIGRSIFVFDTSSLGSNATITSATFSVRGVSKSNDLSLSSDHIKLSLVSATTSSNNSIQPGDYDGIGSTRLSSDISYSVFSTSGFNNYSLNASGLAAINKTGQTKLALLLAVDVDNGSPNWVSGVSSLYQIYTHEHSTSYAPKLTIIYNYPSFIQYSNSNPYASGSFASRTSGGSWSTLSSADLYFVTNTSDNSTSVAYASDDPGDIVEAVIDNFNDSGGTLTYSPSSVDTTGTSVSYTFNTNTVLEAINKVLEMSPDDWYWYADLATNLIHFHSKSETADHTFTLGKDIELIRIEKRTENIINTIYFNGGDTGGGTNLYIKYQDTESVGIYGIRSMRYTDERVTLTSTANIIANKILNANRSPEIRLTLGIADNNLGSLGYDIESIRVGHVINVRNTSGSSGSSLWDVAQWDDDRWDYNISDISTMYLQVSRTEYSPNRLTIYCSNQLPDVSKRIEDIARNLELNRTADNPETPS